MALESKTIPCPRCQRTVVDRPVVKYHCGHCGHRWPRVLTIPFLYEVQRSEGESAQGFFDRIQIRQQLYTGALTGRERVRPPGSDRNWTPIAQLSEFSSIFSLLDAEHRGDGQRIRGWQSSNNAEQVASPSAQKPARPVLEELPPDKRRVYFLAAMFLVVVLWLLMS